MEVSITRTTPLFPNAVFVQWNIESTEPGVHLVDVDRSGAPAGPWERILDASPDTYQFVDDKFNLPGPAKPGAPSEGLNYFSLGKDVYYRITVTPPSGEVKMSEATPIEPGLDRRTRLLKRKILRDETIAFRRLNGIELIALKRRHWGERCPNCFDNDLKEGLSEHCSICYGTTYKGGYWSPVSIRGRREPAPVKTTMTAEGKTDIQLARFTILDYPLMEEDDLIIDLRRNNRWVVKDLEQTELKSVIVHQKLSCSDIARDAVEYTIPIDPNTLPSLY
jgi:hypothetical protein